MAKEKDINTIAHESYHACYRILKPRAIKMDEELVAYLMGWMVSGICEVYNLFEVKKSSKEKK